MQGRAQPPTKMLDGWTRVLVQSYCEVPAPSMKASMAERAIIRFLPNLKDSSRFFLISSQMKFGLPGATATDGRFLRLLARVAFVDAAAISISSDSDSPKVTLEGRSECGFTAAIAIRLGQTDRREGTGLSGRKGSVMSPLSTPKTVCTDHPRFPRLAAAHHVDQTYRGDAAVKTCRVLLRGGIAPKTASDTPATEPHSNRFPSSEVVGRRGLEPLTPCASCKCATNCANGPYLRGPYHRAISPPAGLRARHRPLALGIWTVTAGDAKTGSDQHHPPARNPSPSYRRGRLHHPPGRDRARARGRDRRGAAQAGTRPRHRAQPTISSKACTRPASTTCSYTGRPSRRSRCTPTYSPSSKASSIRGS